MPALVKERKIKNAVAYVFIGEAVPQKMDSVSLKEIITYLFPGIDTDAASMHQKSFGIEPSVLRTLWQQDKNNQLHLRGCRHKNILLDLNPCVKPAAVPVHAYPALEVPGTQ